jgi:hypothetical protein
VSSNADLLLEAVRPYINVLTSFIGGPSVGRPVLPSKIGHKAPNAGPF